MNNPLTFLSTNQHSDPVNFKEALFTGLAPDGGLFMPEKLPALSLKELLSFRNSSYPEIAATILSKFLDEPDYSDLLAMASDAYNFDIPIEQVNDIDFIIRLDRGPTASFKDFAARMMARLMHFYWQKESRQLNILVATSGDTGSAVANAFYGLNNITVTILFPENEVTSFQRRQMTTLGGNIKVLAIAGKFDDCQALVKQAFLDPQLKDKNLTSSNSINIGRLLPQSVYYFYAWSRLTADDPYEPLIFSVPSGNFGNLTGGLLAKKMGLPVPYFIAATNENDEFPRYLNTGQYQKISPSRNCISNAMNVGHPSNMPRIISLFGGQMDERGAIHFQPDLETLRKVIRGFSISDEETRHTILSVWKSYKTFLEPHGAVGWKALSKYRKADAGRPMKGVVLETAHPVKFSEEICKVLGFGPAVPENLSSLLTKTEHYSPIPFDYPFFQNLMRKTL